MAEVRAGDVNLFPALVCLTGVASQTEIFLKREARGKMGQDIRFWTALWVIEIRVNVIAMMLWTSFA